MWARHDIRSLEGGTATVEHPIVGELRLYRDTLPVDGLIVVTYYAGQGSASAEKLRVRGPLAVQPAGTAASAL